MTVRHVTLIVCAAALIMAAGCVSQQVSKQPKETVLIVAGAGDVVTLQWKTEPGSTYTVLYTDKLGGVPDWNVLPNGQNLLGTGQMITMQDGAPDARRRYYRLQVRRPAAK